MPDIENLDSSVFGDDQPGAAPGGGGGAEHRPPLRKSDSEPSLSRSASSSSYISAVDIEEEALNMVPLHQQLNKPITDSILLMKSYLGHLTQVGS